MPYVLRNLIAELCRPEHLTDHNIADRLGVALDDLHAAADLPKKAGVIIDDAPIDDDSGVRHVTRSLKHGKDKAANEELAVSAVSI